MIDFDVSKVPTQRHREAETRRLLQSCGFDNYRFPEDVQYGHGSHFAGIRNWLAVVGAKESTPSCRLRSLAYHLTNLATGKHLYFYKFMLLRTLPEPLVRLVRTFYHFWKRR